MNKEQPPLRVLIVEDVVLLRENYFRLLNMSPGFVCVGALPDAMTIVSFLQISMPDVVLMDINLPGKSGIEAVREVREAGISVPIVMQTIFEDDDKVFESILAGANGYIIKSASEEFLLMAIREAVLGGSPLTPGIAAKVLRFLREKPKNSPQKQPIPGENELNGRQLEILELLIEGVSYRLIAEELFISLDTVRYHVKNIYRILHVHSRAELVRNR